MRRLLSWVYPLIVMVGLITPSAFAQANRGGPETAESGRNPPAMQYAIAVLSTIAIMVVLCMPSRKRQAK
jgi:hypothetical protein